MRNYLIYLATLGLSLFIVYLFFFAKPKWPNIALPSFYDQLVEEEKKLGKNDVLYRDYAKSLYWRPEAFYRDQNKIFVYSSHHTEQVSLLKKNEKFTRGSQRKGPLKTVRCLSMNLKGVTSICLGEQEPGGFQFYGKKINNPLPKYLGYRDFARVQNYLYVIDSVQEEIVVLKFTTKLRLKIIQRIPALAATKIKATKELLVYTTHINPRLNILFLKENHLIDTTKKMQHSLLAPARFFEISAKENKNQYLFTIGPKNTRVRRENGGIKNLSSYLYAYSFNTLLQPSKRNNSTLQADISLDLGTFGFVDASSLLIIKGHPLVCARASNACVLIKIKGQDFKIHKRIDTGLSPMQTISSKNSLLVANSFSNSITINSLSMGSSYTLQLGQANRFTRLAELGEAIFYTASLGSDRYEDRFSCNSCHFNGLVDGRRHFGGSGGQGQIRPAVGAGMLGPIFPTMHYPTVSMVVEEFFKAMNYDFWSKPWLPDWWWLKKKTLFKDRPEQVILSAKKARRALLYFLMRAPVEPPRLRKIGQPLSPKARAGFDIFWRDCIRCHKPIKSFRQKVPYTKKLALAYLKTKPLVFGAAMFIKTGIHPHYTKQGVRVNPLTNLNRSSSYFTNGSAHTLRQVILMTNVTKKDVHSLAFAKASYYKNSEVEELLAFLNSI